MTDPTLYERLGGETAITAMMGMFYERVTADASLAPFFADLDMDRQINKQIAFMTVAFGGPHAYRGRDLRTAHAPLLSKGLDGDHFDAVAGHLEDTLEAMGVSVELVEAVMRIIETMKSDVLGL